MAITPDQARNGTPSNSNKLTQAQRDVLTQLFSEADTAEILLAVSRHTRRYIEDFDTAMEVCSLIGKAAIIVLRSSKTKFP
jgi:hypothetical protein